MAQKQYKEGLKLTNTPSFHGKEREQKGRKSSLQQLPKVLSAFSDLGAWVVLNQTNGQRSTPASRVIACLMNICRYKFLSFKSFKSFHPSIKLHRGRCSRGGERGLLSLRATNTCSEGFVHSAVT